MKSFALFIFGCLLTLHSPAQQGNSSIYQLYYLKARSNPEIAAFYQYCKQQNTNSPLVKSYLGTATAMYASCAENVIDKLSYFNQGTSLLDEAVNQEPFNPEIRFLRLSVQEKSPRMLNYNNYIEQDALIILDAFRKKKIQKSHAFWEIALNFILSAEQVSASTKAQFKGI